MLVITGTVLAVGTAVGLAMDTGKGQRKTNESPKPQVEAVLTDVDPRGLGIDSLATQLRQLQAGQARLERSMAQQERDQKIQKTDDKVSDLEGQLKVLQQELGRVEREGSGKSSGDANGESPAHVGSGNAGSVSPIPARSEHFVPKATASTKELSDVYSNLPPPPPVDPKARTNEKKEAPKIRTIKSEDDSKKEEKPHDLSVTLPAGSILSGVIVSGMDAPTGKHAQKNPFPSLIRLKDEAILPNRFRADFRECFLVAGGYGDLSSERAYLRAERISCVRDDGSVLEASLDAYATGEDGKAGIRGRLVSKQGQILAKSMMAGFMQGVSSAFNVRQVPSIRITRNNQGGGTQMPVYEQAFNADAMQGAVVGGVGSALEKVADFYLQMAENMFPVIEIDSMRDVDFIVKRGMTVKFNPATLKVSEETNPEEGQPSSKESKKVK